MKQISVRLDDALWERLKVISESEYRAVSRQARVFIRAGIKRYELEGQTDKMGFPDFDEFKA